MQRETERLKFVTERAGGGTKEKERGVPTQEEKLEVIRNFALTRAIAKLIPALVTIRNLTTVTLRKICTGSENKSPAVKAIRKLCK